MASKKDLPQVAGLAKAPSLSKPNILEHLSGGHMACCEVRSERAIPSRPRKKNKPGVRMPKHARKKPSASKWPQQQTDFDLQSAHHSINSSLYVEDRVQSARLPPSALSSHVLSSEPGPLTQRLPEPPQEAQAPDQLEEHARPGQRRLRPQRRRKLRHFCPRGPLAAQH
jgi:hypothetical protein